MRRSWALPGVLIVGGVLASCDTTQPAQVGPQTTSLQFDASAVVEFADFYDKFVDTNVPPDGFPDEQQGTECRHSGVPQSGLVFMPYDVELSVLRAGTLSPEIIGTTFTTDASGPRPPFTNLTLYDTPQEQPAPDLDLPPLYYRNGRRFTPGSREFRINCQDFSSADRQIPQQPTILGVINSLSSPTKEFSLNAGDTVFVKAHRIPGSRLPYSPFATGVTFESRLVVGGRVVTVQGNGVTTLDSGTISFLYAAQ